MKVFGDRRRSRSTSELEEAVPQLLCLLLNFGPDESTAGAQRCFFLIAGDVEDAGPLFCTIATIGAGANVAATAPDEIARAERYEIEALRVRGLQRCGCFLA